MQSEAILITDLNKCMNTLVQDVLTRYLPVSFIKSHMTDIEAIPHLDRSHQLSDLDLFIGTQARVLLTSVEEDIPKEKVELFLG